MELKLNEVEARIVGVLIEKVLSTPEYYPLTLKALVAGCNQRNNRDPVVQFDETTVARTLNQLRHKGLAAVVQREGARAERWKTLAREALALATERHMAVLAELLLRGPQTKAQLRARASRMRHEIGKEEIEEILQGFLTRDPPLIVQIDAGPGKRGFRYAHTLYEEGIPATTTAVTAIRGVAPREMPSARSSVSMEEGSAALGDVSRVVAEVRTQLPRLERGLIELLAIARSLQSRIEELEARAARAGGEGAVGESTAEEPPEHEPEDEEPEDEFEDEPEDEQFGDPFESDSSF